MTKHCFFCKLTSAFVIALIMCSFIFQANPDLIREHDKYDDIIIKAVAEYKNAEPVEDSTPKVEESNYLREYELNDYDVYYAPSGKKIKDFEIVDYKLNYHFYDKMCENKTYEKTDVYKKEIVRARSYERMNGDLNCDYRIIFEETYEELERGEFVLSSRELREYISENKPIFNESLVKLYKIEEANGDYTDYRIKNMNYDYDVIINIELEDIDSEVYEEVSCFRYPCVYVKVRDNPEACSYKQKEAGSCLE
jgi:hypothetical protein